MNKYIIQGGHPLSGVVTVSGAKNAAVAILPAALLVNGTCRIENVPDISDVRLLLEILDSMGAKIRRLSPNTLELCCTNVRDSEASDALVRRIRASYYFIGAQLGRFGHARVALPGGCNFGARPIDQHIKGFEAIGAAVDLGAVLANGTTVIENAAKEPHIVDLANFLNAMGAKVSGAGTDVIKIRGVRSLHGGNYSIIPDQIETGTYMAAVAATGGDVLIQNVIPKHMDCISAKLREMGVKIAEYDDAIRVQRTGVMRRANVKTMPYPGFPTDMQPQIAVCMSLASGVSVITESIYDTRFGYCAELNRMGASIKVDTKVAIITGVEKLHGCTVRACDLRAGAAMVIAGLAADRTTTIEDIEYIERGYENLIGKLTAIGAEIRRVSVPDGTAVPAAV